MQKDQNVPTCWISPAVAGAGERGNGAAIVQHRQEICLDNRDGVVYIFLRFFDPDRCAIGPHRHFSLLLGRQVQLAAKVESQAEHLIGFQFACAGDAGPHSRPQAGGRDCL